PGDQLSVQLNVNGFYDGADTLAPQYSAFVPAVASLVSQIPLLPDYPKPLDNIRTADWDAGVDYRNRNKFVQANLRVDYEATDFLNITSLSSYSRERVKQFADGDGTALTNLNIGFDANLQTFYQELRASGDAGPLSYIVGLAFEVDKTSQAVGTYVPYSTIAYSLGGGANLLDQVSTELDQKFYTQAIFANVDYALGSQVTLHAGLRYTAADLDFNACSKALNATTAGYFTTLANRTLTALGRPNIGPIAPGQCATLG